MKPMPFRYHDPSTVEETLDLLADLEDAKVIAGGQSLMPLMNMRLTGFEDLVDLRRLDDLAGVQLHDDALVIGATTRQRLCEQHGEVARGAPILIETLPHVGHPQTRNRGTVGGSIAHLDPAAELVAVACAMEATIEAVSRRGRRTIEMEDFAVSAFQSCLEPHELIRSVRFPRWSPRHGYAFEEFARRHGDFAVVAVASLVELDDTGRLERVALGLVGMGATPVRAHAVEEALRGEQPSAEVCRRAAQLARTIPATADINGPPEYRQHLAAVLIERALRRACERAGSQHE